jgi:hypothetical protein
VKQKIENTLRIWNLSFVHYDTGPHFSIPKCDFKIACQLKEMYPQIKQHAHPRHLYGGQESPHEWLMFYNEKR